MRLILASASPRRRELISELGLPFEIIPSHADESGVPARRPREFALLAAELKCREIASRPENRDAVVIGCDTIVCFDPDLDFPASSLFGKPSGPEEAFAMLSALSGRAHAVVTAVAVSHPERNGAPPSMESDSEITRVVFKPLTESMIREYIETGEPFDKAGAYGAQGLAGRFIERVEGNLDNVIGLPLALVRRMLRLPPPLQ